MKENKANGSFIILGSLLFLNILVWGTLIFGNFSLNSEIDFLDVGQGDSTLIKLAGVRILSDAGPNSSVVRSLESVMQTEKYIDIGMISHPELDHFNGFNYLLDRYNFGVFIVNGRTRDIAEWQEFLKKVNDRKIPLITLGRDDKIFYQNNKLEIISPDISILGTSELNDTSLVFKLTTSEIAALFLGDINATVEKWLIENYDASFLKADILKVAHHGSKYSSSDSLLKTVDPKIALIGVGKNNYGHPAKETMKKLFDFGIKIFQTGEEGTIKIKIKDNKLQIFAAQVE